MHIYLTLFYLIINNNNIVFINLLVQLPTNLRTHKHYIIYMYIYKHYIYIIYSIFGKKHYIYTKAYMKNKNKRLRQIYTTDYTYLFILLSYCFTVTATGDYYFIVTYNFIIANTHFNFN